MNSEQAHNHEVDALMDQYWNQFLNWKKQSIPEQKFDFPQDGAKVFLPRRVLELQGNGFFQATNVEMLSPINDLALVLYEPGTASFDERIIEEITEYTRFEDLEKKGIILPGFQTIDLDFWRAYKAFYLDQNLKITPKDKVLIHYGGHLEEEYPHVAYTDFYDDRTEFRGIGIGSSFFDRLGQVLATFGCKYLVGDIVSENKAFFEKRWISYNNLPETVKNDLPPTYEEDVNGHAQLNLMVKVI